MVNVKREEKQARDTHQHNIFSIQTPLPAFH